MNNPRGNHIVYVGLVLLLNLFAAGCSEQEQGKNAKMKDVAGNGEVLKFMKTFEGRGALSDSSQPVPAEKAVAAFLISQDLAIDLVLSEPVITQPVFMNFDQRGRLWVVQYDQYPYPGGLKVISMDQHMRARYDKEPVPPPEGVKGADKITIFEDVDGDGTFEKSTNAITGLNIATSVTCGRGQIWVLNPPYLLAYPDADNDGIPDGPPVVHLKGFGIEDTHAVANNLRWGPDGWLYGAQGSTCTANVSSSVTKNVRFNGQAIWRYHPATHVFEIFAEGGGNTFDVEIDEKGRLYSGDNGSSHGQYYKQGAYFPRNLGKHGAFTNPYTFGHLENMIHKGDLARFTHAFIKYEGGNLPSRYQGHMIALNPLQSFVQLSRFEQNGSSFSNIDEEKIMQTGDRWFRPVDITSGPDGGVYIADWYDSRLSHVDPRDTWSKNTGRIYRLRDKNAKEIFPKFDLDTYSNDQLIELLSHKNIWFRQQALRLLGDRKDASVIPKLMKLLKGQDGQTALEALWAINLSGGFNDTVAETGLHQIDPFVRMWSVRLLGDANNISPTAASQLAQLASSEPNAEVRSQLAATAKRLHGEQAIPIIKNLMKNQVDSADPDIPLQLWWALESKAESHRKEVLAIFQDKSMWAMPIASKIILERLMQRYIIAGGPENFTACALLLNLAPTVELAAPLINGLQEGLRGRDIIELSPDLTKALKPYRRFFREESLGLALRQGQRQALDKVLAVIANKDSKLGERLSFIRILGEVNQPKAVPVLLELMQSGESSPAIQQAALLALQRYDNDEIGLTVVNAYPDKLRADPDVRASALALFASRPAWALQLLNAISREKQAGEKFVARTIDKDDVPEQIVKQLTLLNDDAIGKITGHLWPGVIRLATSPEKNATIARVVQLMKRGSANLVSGRGIFISKCAPCHQLFGEGGNTGPDLTGYDRRNLTELLTNIVDPGAYIREGYVANHLTTIDGRTIVGTIKSQGGNTVTIQPFSGEPVTLRTIQVKDMQPQKTSIMPERLLEGLTEQQIRDLVSYIMKQDNQ
ncbi:MAG: PVC-type heme-binding CxxCH protein [Ginsengibacter sp.]